MPRDIPGFYFNSEKNRYFPVKGPMPGRRSTIEQIKQNEASYVNVRLGSTATRLLQVREVYGRDLMLKDCHTKFETEYRKSKASKPLIWIYDRASTCETALEQVTVDVQGAEGNTRTSALLTGSENGIMRLFFIGKNDAAPDWESPRGVSIPRQIWPLGSAYGETDNAAQKIWSHDISTTLPSSISCIRKIRNSLIDEEMCHRVLVTSRGSRTAGCIYILDIGQSFDYVHRALRGRIIRNYILSDTVWAAGCNPDGTRAAIGVNMGAGLYDIETGKVLWICRGKSDVLSVEFNLLGDVLLCGFRNGAIAPFDTRENPSAYRYGSHTENKVHFCPHPGGSSGKGVFKFYGQLLPCGVAFASSAVCSLIWLRRYDQYFLGSSMDGTIKLYDCRMDYRVLQSYKGHVNTHSYLQMGVDPSESLLTAGGQDGYLRIWSILTGQQLFEKKISNEPVSTVSFSRSEGCLKDFKGPCSSTWEAWVGSFEALYCVHG